MIRELQTMSTECKCFCSFFFLHILLAHYEDHRSGLTSAAEFSTVMGVGRAVFGSLPT